MVARPGFSLTELIVGMTLLSVAGLGVAATGLVAVQTFRRAEFEERALLEAEAILDSLLALPASTTGERRIAHLHITWSAADSAGTIVVRVDGGRSPIELVGVR
ncbi:MAG TPA: prepilin-type N-terminal cleavage/methylation domain-containing protein [Steroidobacteraceae bacterium]